MNRDVELVALGCPQPLLCHVQLCILGRVGFQEHTIVPSIRMTGSHGIVPCIPQCIKPLGFMIIVHRWLPRQIEEVHELCFYHRFACHPEGEGCMNVNSIETWGEPCLGHVNIGYEAGSGWCLIHLDISNAIVIMKGNNVICHETSVDNPSDM